MGAGDPSPIRTDVPNKCFEKKYPMPKASKTLILIRSQVKTISYGQVCSKDAAFKLCVLEKTYFAKGSLFALTCSIIITRFSNFLVV